MILVDGGAPMPDRSDLTPSQWGEWLHDRVCANGETLHLQSPAEVLAEARRWALAVLWSRG